MNIIVTIKCIILVKKKGKLGKPYDFTKIVGLVLE